MRALLSPLAACALALAAFSACKPDAARPPPEATASPSPTYGYGMGPTAKVPAGAPQATNPPSVGVGCNGDAEPVPNENEQALRACCAKIGYGNACRASACWAKGLVAEIQAYAAPGGKCTK